ncbi:hypothetical protein HPP92_018363 [Vanilla planifolia]|uniref:Uncharacterized protein n=1 Tax=Vanilla planifolia TaxID=51239 RepID=A0A835QE92_VANPL|nr:hypothetical protein HPP92_018974 [Vanilla planifolia]KAG0469035.1 hypothetical protein HPP92_018363 [Vanilla planifolia]
MATTSFIQGRPAVDAWSRWRVPGTLLNLGSCAGPGPEMVLGITNPPGHNEFNGCFLSGTQAGQRRSCRRHSSP